MPYLGKSPSQGVRTRYLYTATANQTTFSGTDTQNLTLTYSDSNFIDVHQNGVLLKVVDDYTATSGTSVVLGTGATADDVVEIIVYDVFSVGNFYNRTDSDSRYLNVAGDTMTGSLDLNGTELVLDVDGDTSITSDTDDQIDFRAGGTDVMAMSTTGLTVTNATNDAQLTLTSTDADASEGPKLDLYRNSASPADNDAVGRIVFSGENDADEKVDLVRIIGTLSDASDGSEDGMLQYYVTKDGTRINRLTHTPTETSFNDDSADVDFRVESNGDANMFFVDAGNDRIYMGRNASDGVANNRLQIEAQDGEAGVSIHRGSASSGGGGIFFSKSRAATAGDDTVVQSGDEIGKLFFAGADGTDRETPAASISVEVDGTPGSNDMPGRILFTTTADGASSVTERMRIDRSGNVLIGCTSFPDGSADGVSLRADSGMRAFSRGSTLERYQIQFFNPNGLVGRIQTDGSSTGYITSSDYRLKENVVTDWDATTRLKQLKPSRFNFKADKDTTIDGFLAHEVSSIVPKAISGEKDAVDKEGNPEYQGIDQSKLVPLLTKALQESIARADALEARIKKLEDG